MPGNPREIVTMAERRFPVRIRIGAPATVVRNQEVIEAYLGKKWAEQVAEVAK